MASRILLVEDDSDIADLVALHLRDLGCEVLAATDGLTGLSEATSSRFDLLILDLMLPGMDGLEFCRHVREQPDYVPILMLTARSSEEDRVIGLETGADDYLVKPFSIRELVARVKALLRRVEALTKQGSDGTTLKAGDLLLDLPRRKVLVAGRPIELTSKEFDLLFEFAQNPGRVFTRSELLERVWGYGHDGYAHTVNAHINRLRAKIEKDPAEPHYILTVWGTGYKFRDLEMQGT